MNRTSVFKWCREFKNGRTSVHDDQRSGRPSILTDDIVEKIENALRDDRRLTVDELSAMFPQISRSLLHETITETLGYRKLSARWVPKQLTDQHKLNQVKAGQEFLRRYKLHGDEFLRSIVTGDRNIDEVKKIVLANRRITTGRREIRTKIARNAPAHTSLLVREFMAKNNTLMMPQISSDLAPCDATIEEIKTASKEELNKITKNDFLNCFGDWKKRWHKCIISDGDYFEGDKIHIHE
ncbi:GVQW3 protein, partial [Pseudoatta argentina]